jgi:hypothetical protein
VAMGIYRAMSTDSILSELGGTMIYFSSFL